MWKVLLSYAILYKLLEKCSYIHFYIQFNGEFILELVSQWFILLVFHDFDHLWNFFTGLKKQFWGKTILFLISYIDCDSIIDVKWLNWYNEILPLNHHVLTNTNVNNYSSF